MDIKGWSEIGHGLSIEGFFAKKSEISIIITEISIKNQNFVKKKKTESGKHTRGGGFSLKNCLSNHWFLKIGVFY